MVRGALADLEKSLSRERELLELSLPSEELPEEERDLEQELERCLEQTELAVQNLARKLAENPEAMRQEEKALFQELLSRRQQQRARCLERVNELAQKLKAVRAEKKALSGYRPGRKKGSLFVDKKG